MTLYKFIAAIIVASCICQIIQCNSDLTVLIENGAIIGKYEEASSGKKFVAFLGIPFAKPPIGELRFKPPVPIENWNGTLEATSDKAVCLQSAGNAVFGEEDCLHLHVYTPTNFKENKKYSVMVWIHGGAFKLGTGNMAMSGPQILMEHDIVLVSMNYRLGPLGFLSTGDNVVSGNNGLKDQLLALTWCRNNIKYFGGDPGSITIFGISAGSASTHLHMLSPLSKGLFHAAISQSGSALADWAVHTPKEALTLTKQLATSCKCPTDSNIDMIECLNNASAYEIVKNQKYLWDLIEPVILFRPVVEEKHDGAFLDDYPLNIMKSGKQFDVPWMAGFTTDEGCLIAAALYATPKHLDLLETNFGNILLKTMVSSNKKVLDVSQEIRQFFFGNEHIKTNKQGLIDLYSEGMFTYSIDEMIRLYRQEAQNPVYYYVFGFKGSRSISSIIGDNDDYGVCHGDDMFYLFKTSLGDDGDANDAKVSNILTTMWINFAKYHNPTFTNIEKYNIEWQPVSSENNEYLYIGGPENIQMKNNVFKKRLNFWRSLNLKSKTFTRDEL